MTTLIRGELIKATTTRTIFAYGAMAVVLAVGQALALILPGWGDPMSLADKTHAIAGLPLLVLLLGLVGGARHARRRSRPRLRAARAGGRLRCRSGRGGRVDNDGGPCGRPATAGAS